MKIMEKVILTDCDGVLLNWESHFDEWMNSNGYYMKPDNRGHYDICLRYGLAKPRKDELVRAFNESAVIGFLPPHRDAVKYVRKLHEEYGYVFRVITSLSKLSFANYLRVRNLREVFGTAIEQVICLDTGADKDEALEPYRGRNMFWIEDKPQNALVGSNVGLTSILMLHDHNVEEIGPFIKVRTWREIYEHLAT